LQGKLIGWLIWFGLLLGSAVIVPYYFLSGVESFYGAFLYWGLFALAAIVSVVVITASWRD